MPLLYGQPFDLPPPATQPSAREQQQGWQIRFTGEEFGYYDQYLDRLQFYRKPVWTCAATGQSSLTYEQALLSERASRHSKTGIGFSDMLICEMLTFLSHSTMSIALAVDALYYRFQYDFFVGEHIDVKYPDTNGAMYECFVVSIEPLPTDPVEPREEETLSAQAQATRLSIERLGDASNHVIAYERRRQRIYTVRLYDVDGKPIDDSDISVAASELSRSRNMFTKVAIRQFLDENMRRDPRPSSPWIVCAQWRERFRIPYMYGGEARLLKSSMTKTNGSSNRRGAETPGVRELVPVDPYADERDLVVKQYRKVPMDDLEYLQFKHVRYAQGILWALRRKQQKLEDGSKPKGTHQITDYFPVTAAKHDSDEEGEKEEVEEEDLRNTWPVPLCEWQVSLPLVSRTLSVYMFISCFSAPLALDPYPLDYFESALVYSPLAANEEGGACSVYRETVVALLNSLIDDRRRNPAAANVSARIEAMIIDQDGNISESPAATDMEIDIVKEEEPKKKTKKTRHELLPPVAPTVLGARSAKTRATRTIAKQANATGSENGARSGRSTRASGRLQRVSMLSASSSIGSSSGSESEESGSEPESVVSGTKQRPSRKGGSLSSAASSESDSPRELVSDMARLAVVRRPHELLRRLSRTWANAQVAQSHWAAALAGWLLEASRDYAAELTPLAAELWATPSLTLATLEHVMWDQVLATPERRLAVLELLVSECASNERIRTLLDACTDQAAELKRERVEIRRELKRVAEALADLDRDLEEEPEMDAFSRDQSRRSKEAEAQRQKERRRLGETERNHMRRLDYVGRELRRLNVGRLTPLGCDRFFNRYFFIDGVAGCPASGSGRVLVQPPSRAEQAEALDAQPRFVINSWALSMPHAWSGGLQLRGPEAQTLAPFVDITDEHLAPLARAGELWGYYATTSQIDRLKRWLDPRGGKREAALAAELDLLQVSVSASLRKRCQQLEQFYAARAKARDQVSAQIAQSENDDTSDACEKVLKLQKELARIESEPMPSALLPPHVLVDRQRSSTPANGTSGVGSSRASSVEPALSVSGAQTVVKPGRGRKPKIPRVERIKTYMDEFLEYENITTTS
ncbi:hypothetical protein GGI20_005048 [Coemansia sp. BCRC 34301]|nr:hypothetical protein GGI20_005048 [Coemansia sp. BCRC 34301]